MIAVASWRLRRLLPIVAAALCLNAPAVAQGLFNTTTSVVVLSAASTNSQMVGSVGPHQIVGITALSQAAASMDLRLYDTATAPTCSSASGLKGNYIIAGATAPAVGGFTLPLGVGKTFLLGVGICITGGNTNTDNTNAAVGAVINFDLAGN